MKIGKFKMSKRAVSLVTGLLAVQYQGLALADFHHGLALAGQFLGGEL